MDRNKDGFLTSDELPKSLLPRIASADLNKDGKWTATELSTVSQQAKETRAKESATSGQSRLGSRNQNRAGRGRGPARPDSGLGSPLDAAQILKFALTFDLDKDGGLNKDELGRYAAALAVRRSRARRLRESDSPNPQDRQGPKNGLAIPSSEVPDRAAPTTEASGLKSKSDSKDGDPFGSGKGNDSSV